MEAVKSTKRLARRRPAEVTGGAASVLVGAVIGLFKLNLDAGQAAAIVALLGLIPGVITWWRTR